jgi:energy-coupling factor transport system substrate-specific component
MMATLFVCQSQCVAAGDTSSAESGSQEKTNNIAVNFTGNDEGYAAVLYDNTNGLPAAEANAIAETSEGFIWIGSYSGLIRYDGNTFERIDSTTGITSVVRLFVDSKDRLWIGTNDNGVAVMVQGESTLYNRAEGLKSSTIRSIVEDPNGNIYLGTTQGIAVIGEDMSLHMLNEEPIRDVYVRQLKMTGSGVLYGLSMDGAVFTIENEKVTGYYERSELGVDALHAILPDEAHPGYLYLGTQGSDIYYGELKKGTHDWKVIDTAPLEYINTMKQIQDEIWICADNGIGIVDENGFRKIENIPMNNSIERMMTDYQGNLWFVSSRQGVMKIVPSQFLDITERYKLPAEVTNATCLYHNQLLIGKDTGLTVLHQGSVVDRIPLKKAETASGEPIDASDLIQLLDGCKIRSIILDSKDQLWFSTYGEHGLIRYKDGTATCFTEADGMPSDRIRTIVERTDGSYMVACTGGAVQIEGDRITKVYNESCGISNTEVLTLAEGLNGDMLLGTDGGGIYVLRDGRATQMELESGLSSGIVMRIKPDKRRDLFWIVTSNSIAFMDADYHVTTVQNFPYSNNFDVYENSREEMWILSSNGLYVVPVEELLANGEISPVYYGRESGLPCIATANSYSELTDDGDLYISGSTGVARVNIERTFEDVENVKMAVPYVVADGEYIHPNEDGAFNISSNVKKLTIYSYIYTYSLMDPQVTYYLDGFEKKAVTEKRSEMVPVDYTNLSGGTYHFVMQLRDARGHRGKAELSVPIIKKKAFYEMPWFYVVCALLGLFILAEGVRLYIQRKTRVLLKKQEENKLLTREIVQAFAKTIDMKDKYTNGHSTRVAEYTAMLTRELGYDEDTVDTYYNIALLHDIGKIGTPEGVLNNPGKLTDQEFSTVMSHATLGYNALKEISILPELAIGAGFHHERPDGKGYPMGLEGDEIPRVAQIIAVADTFDAMYSNRPYRKRMNFDRVVSIIKRVSGTQLTSDVVDAFLRLVEKGEFRDPEDHGGGAMEDIDNIHKQ